MRRIYYPFILLAGMVMLMGIQSCESDEVEYEVGDEFVNDPGRLIAIDTVTVHLSTYQSDSVSTSNEGRILAGTIDDPWFGKTSFSSPVYFNYTSTIEPGSDARFDSITISLKFDNFLQGDSLSMQHLQFYPLTEVGELEDDYLRYATRKFDYREDELLGETRFYADEVNDSLLEIRIDDSLGLKLFKWAQEKNDTLTTESLWEEFLPGIAIVPGAESEIINSFQLYSSANSYSSGSPKVTIYYHEKEIDEEQEIPLNLTYSSYQYNRQESDRKNTLLAGITPDGEPIPSSETDEKAFIQGISGLMAKIEIPSIKHLNYVGEGVIMSAVLAFKPTEESYSDAFPLPKQLMLYTCSNKTNDLQGTVTNSSGSTSVTSVFHEDTEFDNDTEFTIDITSYLREEFDSEWNTERALLMAIPESYNHTDFSRLVLDSPNGKNPMELRIYYLIPE